MPARVAIRTLTEKIEELAGWFILLSGWPRYLIAMASGAVSALSMPPFDFFFILFVTFPILVWIMDGVASDPEDGFFHRVVDGFKPGFCFGFGYFLAGLWWIGNAFLVDAQGFLWVLPIAIVAVPAVLAIFWGFATALSRLFWTGDYRRLFILAAFLGVSEYLRSFVATGFPWNPIGAAAYFNSLAMQSASILGTYAITPFAVLVFATLGILAPGSEYQRRGKHFAFSVSLVIIIAHMGYGSYRLSQAETAFVDNVSLRLMQPNIDQRVKFDPQHEAEIIRTYLDLSTSENGEGKGGLSGTTHLIWPESSFPFFLTERRDVLASIEAMLPEGTSLITGAVRGEAASGPGPGFVFNSVYVVNHVGEIVSAADKTHLVPFGEYLPFQGLLESWGIRQVTDMEGGFEPGSSRRFLSTGTGPSFLSLICYEIIFSGDLWKPGEGEAERPQWIVNVTNDGWFGNTPGPYQHERQAVIRAVEEGLPVVRVANTGISGVYDAYGRPVKRLGLGEAGIIDSKLPTAISETTFASYGSFIMWAVFALFMLVGLLPNGRVRSTFA